MPDFEPSSVLPNKPIVDHFLRPADQADGPITETFLLRQVAAGDESAFNELYRLYNAPIYTYLLHLIHEPAEAEDLLQEVFVAVWKQAASFRGQAKVKTWLLQIAHNQAVSWLRKNSCEQATLDGGLPEATTAATPLDQVADLWRAGQVRSALDQLSRKHRAVVELAFVHGLSHSEIAQIIDRPLGTVKSRMSYALHYLAETLREMGLAPGS
ncbi:MAG: RNA polymerase sigma factor [Thermoflexales bacterium]|nr:RNA polymerase sigma factor [Thermoflexales bacterium]